MNALIVSRHAHSLSNVADVVNGIPPGEGLSAQGIEEARALEALLAMEPIDAGISSGLERTRETLALALAGRDVPCEVEPRFGEIGFGSFEGGPLDAYRTWAWSHAPEAPCPGGGETRVHVAERLAAALLDLLGGPEETILVVSHGLPLRYVLDAAEGRSPQQRVGHLPNATPFRLERRAVETAAETLAAWVAAPAFADTPSGG